MHSSPYITSAAVSGRLIFLTLWVLCLSLSPTAHAGQDSRVVAHAQGTTRITGTPKRVVTLFQGANDTAVALGITPAGVVDAWAQGANYDYLDTALEGVPHVGLETQPSMEAIVLLQPDLIIASKRRHEKIYDQLSQIAPTVSLDTVFDVHQTLKVMGQALNRETRAQALWRAWEHRLTDFRQQAGDALGEQWPMSATVLNIRADHARLYLDSSYAGSVLHSLGFTRPTAHPKNQWVLKLTTKESIPIIDADVVFYFMKDETAVQDNFDAWTDHPLWDNLDAVREERVYAVDRVDWSLAGGILGANRMLDQLIAHFGLDEE
ncbi:ABC transporter substrate-binding protein [Marinobacter sp.]|uniref:ABC transporter substrate-binding protein n=1 Tax=Marinobacter sp. TaxID=50741 RepID=UPI0034A1D850